MEDSRCVQEPVDGNPKICELFVGPGFFCRFLCTAGNILADTIDIALGNTNMVLTK